ncbi:putative elongation factor 1-gamma, partial [Araneus ventricosus]
MFREDFCEYTKAPSGDLLDFIPFS